MSYEKIGKIIQTSGLNGKVVFSSEIPAGKVFPKIEHFFIELQKGHFIPFFPEQLPILTESEKVVLQLEDIHSVDAAKTLVGKNVYIESDKFKKIFPSNIAWNEDLSGFQIMDIISGNSGIIESIISASGQMLANVFFREKELLLPLSEDFVLSVDEKKKKIEMKLPEGIWDL